MADRTPLPGIAPTAWEHPADRAALQTLRATPGLDEAVRAVMSLLGERGVHQLFTADAVRVGPRQRPRLHALLGEVLETLDAPERPRLFVAQTPVANAMAVGFRAPFVVVNSGALALLGDDERRVLLGHKVGHVLSGHTTYTTLALLVIMLGQTAIPGLALLTAPIRLALLEWYRKAELSADRAGLLAAQDPRAAMGLFLRFAGGVPSDDETSLDEYLVQAEEYDTGGSTLDTVFRILNVLDRTHPFNTVRAAELQRWVRSGAYERILAGEYPRRGVDDRPLRDDYAAAAAYYGGEVRSAAEQAAEQAASAARRVGDVLGGLFRDGRGHGAP